VGVGWREDGPNVLENRGLIQSLALRAQRELIREVGEELNAPVLFLKAAWADPVLYGNEGKRYGTDIDVLVPRAAFDQFSQRLEARGFRYSKGLGGERGRYFENREISLSPPVPSAFLSIDLHRELSDADWFRFPPGELFDRAIDYRAGNETIRSLCPEDQVLYACIHYAVHALELDGRHLQDIVHVVDRFPLDWNIIERRAHDMGLEVMLCLLHEALTTSGKKIPPLNLPRGRKLRAAIVRKITGTPTALTRTRQRGRLLDYLVTRPLLSDRWSAGPRFAWNFGGPWIREELQARLHLKGGTNTRAGVVHTVGSPLPARTFVEPTVQWLRRNKINAYLWSGSDHASGAPKIPLEDAKIMDSDIIAYPRTLPLRLFKLCVELRRQQPRAVHAHLTRSATLPLLAARITGVPIRIYHNHGFAFQHHTGLLRFVGLSLERLNIALGTHVLFASVSSAQTAVRAGLIPAQPVEILGHGSDAGIDVERFAKLRLPAQRKEARARWSIPDDTFVLGFMGRPVAHKGIKILIEAWLQIETSVQPGMLLLAGCTESDTTRLSGRPQHPSVRSLGFLDAVESWYAAVDAVVLPSSYEGFPNTLLEAGAAGIATIGTRVDGTVDAIVDGETGILVPPVDADALGRAITQLARDVALRERMGTAARNRTVALFSRDRVMGALVQKYRAWGLLN